MFVAFIAREKRHKVDLETKGTGYSQLSTSSQISSPSKTSPSEELAQPIFSQLAFSSGGDGKISPPGQPALPEVSLRASLSNPSMELASGIRVEILPDTDGEPDRDQEAEESDDDDDDELGEIILPHDFHGLFEGLYRAVRAMNSSYVYFYIYA